MKVLVSGGAGFIGSNLCEYLVAKGYKVIVVDDLSSGSEANLANLRDSISFHKEKVEYFDFSTCVNIDIVVHLAAQASVPLSISDFEESSKTNLLSAIKVIDYCSSKCIPLVYASSSAIYGGICLGDDVKNDIDLISPYAVDKYAMELYAEVAFKLHGLSSMGLRFFNVYGPRQDPSSPYSGVISIFVDRLIKNHPIFINGGGQTRDFVFVSDVVESIHRSMLLTLSRSTCDCVNILTGNSVTINELAKTLVNNMNSHSTVHHKEYLPGDPLESNGTTEKMENILGVNLSNMTSLADGLNETIDFLRRN